MGGCCKFVFFSNKLTLATLTQTPSVDFLFGRNFNKRDPLGKNKWDTMRDITAVWERTGAMCVACLWRSLIFCRYSLPWIWATKHCHGG